MRRTDLREEIRNWTSSVTPAAAAAADDPVPASDKSHGWFEDEGNYTRAFVNKRNEI